MTKAISPNEAITAARPPIAPTPAPAPKARPHPVLQWLKKYVLEPLASLRLTVILFALSLFLVFAGTLAQAESGNLTVINQYFRSYGFIWIPWQVFVKFGQVFLQFPSFLRISPDAHIGGSFPFPGGWMLGVVLMTNLLAAHALRFRFTWKDLFVLPLFALGVVLLCVSEAQHSRALYWVGVMVLGASLCALLPLHAKRSGIILIHLGLIVMMTSEWVTGHFAAEGTMTLTPGESSNFVDDNHECELAVINRSDPKTDDVMAIPGARLRSGQPIRDKALPFDIVVEKYMVNSRLVNLRPGARSRATKGDGLQIGAEERPEVSGADTEQGMDIASAYVTLKKKGTGESLGTYLVSLWFYSNFTRRQLPDLPQRVHGTDYELMLRAKRTYRPFSVRLIEFQHERFPGTNTPKNFASRVRLVDARPGQEEDREIKIWMNHPLRYEGETFYQQAFLSGDSGTILQVVRNPGAEMPYIACIMVALGMLVHFGLHLQRFLFRRAVS